MTYEAQSPRRLRQRRTLRVAVAALAAGLACGTLQPAVAAPAATAASATSGDNVVLQWNSAMLDVAKDSKLPPTVLARGVQVMHTCAYDAWAAYDSKADGTRYGDDLRRPKSERTLANKNKAISYAAYLAALDIVPEAKPKLDALMAKLGYQPEVKAADHTTPEGVGLMACRAVLDYRHHDGSNQLGDLHPGAYSDFTGWKAKNAPMVVGAFDPATVKDPNGYQPLVHPSLNGSTATDGFLSPHWGNVRMFTVGGLPEQAQNRAQKRLLEKIRRTNTPGPATYGSRRYIKQANEVIRIQAHLTDRQKATARYWTFGPENWNALVRWVSHRDHHTVDDDAKMFFATANAMGDAGVAAWYVKRYYDSERPITAIRYLYHGKKIPGWGGLGQGTKSIDGGEWMPYQLPTSPTPPFPEYVSGHSTFSGAVAEILRSFTGSDKFGDSAKVPAGSLPGEPNLPKKDVTLSWPTFSDAVDEAGISRLYGGVHFTDGNVHGKALGRAVGKLDWKLMSKYFNGTAS